MGSALPTFLTNSSSFNASIPLINQTISWLAPTHDDWNGFVLLIDDVERYKGPALNFSLASLQVGLPHIFRLAVSRDIQYCYSVCVLLEALNFFVFCLTLVYERRWGRGFHYA